MSDNAQHSMDTSSGYITVSDVSKTYASASGDVNAIDNVSLAVKPGEFVSILGPSGCGKSTLLMAIAGLESVTRGEITVAGAPVTAPLTDLGIVFQKDALLPWRSVRRNVLLQVELRRLKPEAFEHRCDELLAAVGMSEFDSRYPAELSGGMRQRVSICRALVHDPPLLLMDEPFAALDAMTREKMSRDLEALWERNQCTVVFVTHSIEEALTLSDRIILMSPRPSRIAREFIVDLPRPRDFSVRESSAFQDLLGDIRHSLHELGAV